MKDGKFGKKDEMDNKEKLEKRVARLEALQEVSLELTRERDLDRLLDLIMNRITFILEADRSSLFIMEEDESTGDRWLITRISQGVDEIRVALDERSVAGYVATRGEKVNLVDAQNDHRLNKKFDERHGYKTETLLAVPMRNAMGQIIGVTEALNKKGAKSFDGEDEELLSAFSAVAAAAIENTRWLELQKRTFETIIKGQAVAIDARDHITGGHTWRVTAFAVEIGRAMGMKDEELEVLRYAGLLHDQGKLGVPDSILLKPGRLNEWEFSVMRSHAYKTKVILKAVRHLFPARLRRVCDIAPAHHEKLDGTGYPDGLKEEEISLPARILAVADIFDALTAARPYKKPFSQERALEMLGDLAAGNKVDGQAVEALKRCLPEANKVRDEINVEIANRRSAINLVSGEGVSRRE